MGQYRRTNTKNKIGNTARETLSISRHMIFSTPVSVSVHATDSKLCRLAGFGGPPLPCKEVCARIGTEKSNHNRILVCNMLITVRITNLSDIDETFYNNSQIDNIFAGQKTEKFSSARVSIFAVAIFATVPRRLTWPGVVGVCVAFRDRTAPPSQLATVAH